MAMPEQHAERSDRSPARLVLLVLLPALVVVAGVAIFAVISGTDVGDIMRDPATTMDAHPLVGALSQVGVILWWITAGICLFAYVVARSLGGSRQTLVLLLTSGLLTVVLAIDDQFLIHDDLASRYLDLRERDVMVVLLALAAGWLLLNLAAIRRSEWYLLATALALFAASIATDLLLQTFLEDPSTIGSGFDVGLLLEDGLKFAGIAAWSAYLVRFSYFALLARPGPRGPASSGAT